MTVFEYHNAGNSEAQQKGALAYLLTQDSVGKATNGVLYGLGVSQTTTASKAVLVAAGAGVIQAAVVDGASQVVNDTQVTLDILTGNPMGATPRNDLVVLDVATMSVRAIIGDPNEVPTDPTVPTSAIALARVRQAASATTIPSSAIDDLRTYTTLAGAAGPWVSFAPWIYHFMTTTPAEISRTVNYARWRYIGGRTVQAQADVTIVGNSTNGVGIGLPLAGAYRSFDCGTAAITGAGAPTSQTSIAYMHPDLDKLVMTDFTNAYLNAVDGNRLRYSVIYEVA